MRMGEVADLSLSLPPSRPSSMIGGVAMTMIAARISFERGHYNAPVNQICRTSGQPGGRADREGGRQAVDSRLMTVPL